MTKVKQGSLKNTGPRVLVVDDDANLRRFLQSALARLGFEVITAESGAGAIAMAEKTGFDACLTDLKLPGMPGEEIIGALLKIDPGLDIIVMTGYASIDSAIACMKAGAHDYLQKPVDMNRLEIILRRAVEKKMLERKLEEIVKTRDCLVRSEKLSLAGKFAGAILHEMNNPLSFVISNMKMVRESLREVSGRQVSGGDEILEDIFAGIDESITGAERISELLSGLSRVSMQPLGEDSRLVDLNRFVALWYDDIVTRGYPGAGDVCLKNGQDLQQARVAPSNLMTALSNILTFLQRAHSRKAAETGPRFDVTVAAGEGPPSIEIRDDSLRLPEEERLTIFDPRIDLDKEGGTTLRMDIGLAIANQIAASQQAELLFESDATGTSFRIVFPQPLV
ncbi:MAG TPA: response regulator [Myxococcota bacterium]|nr:response regulator [Myxococcota bacterium]